MLKVSARLLPGTVCHDRMNYGIYELFVVATATSSATWKFTLNMALKIQKYLKPYCCVLHSNPSCPHPPHSPPLDQSFQECEVKVFHINLLRAAQAL